MIDSPPEEGQIQVLQAAGVAIPATKAEASRLIRNLPKYRARRCLDITITDQDRKFPNPRTHKEINRDI